MPVKDDSLIAQYIRAIENPDSIGFKNGRWVAPPASKGYDPNSRGFGIDVMYNNQAHALTNTRQDRWLSEEEEKEIRKNHTDYIKDRLDKWTPSSYILRHPITEEKEAMALGMMYRGDNVKKIIKNPTLRDAYYSGSNEDMQKAVSDYYRKNNVTKRAELHDKFFNFKGSSFSNNIPQMIRKPSKWSPAKFGDNQFMPKKFADGGDLSDNYWNNLSMKDKAEMIKVAIANGITTLPEIKQAYNEFAKGGKINNWTMQDEAGYRYWRSRLPRNLRDTNDNDYDMRAAYKAGMKPEWNDEDKSYHLGSRDPQSGRILKAPHHPTFLKALIEDARLGYYPTTDRNGSTYTSTWKANEFAGGGYKPSAKLQRDIATWEGSEMKRNAPFSEVTRQFNAAIPASIRAKLSTNQLDALYSYGYNVGMGNLKKRVLPTLNNYVQGRATNEDVQRSMWASKDNVLRGLTRRRNWEREMFGGNYRSKFTGTGLGTHIDPTLFQTSQGTMGSINSMINDVNIPEMQFPDTMNIDPSIIYKPPVIDDTLFVKPKQNVEVPVYDPKQERMDNLQKFNTIMGLFGQDTPFTGLVDNNMPSLLNYVGRIYS